MTVINDYQSLHPECCLCKSQTTLLTSESAYVSLNKKEYRVHFHKVCFQANPNATKIITEKLNEMVKDDAR